MSTNETYTSGRGTTTSPPNNIGSTPSPQGRGNRNGRNGNRNHRGNGRGAIGPRNEGNKVTSTFRGTVKEMNGHVLQMYGEATHKNQYSRTIKEIASYVGLHFKRYPADIKRMATTLTETVIERPNDLPEPPSKFDIRLWEKDDDLYATQVDAYRNNKCTLYALV